MVVFVMNEYSKFIVEAMKYIDEKIESIDPRSIDRQRLHSSVNTALMVEVKKLMQIEPEKQKDAIDYIFRTQLNAEMLKKH